jgi:hypothetical protein
MQDHNEGSPKGVGDVPKETEKPAETRAVEKPAETPPIEKRSKTPPIEKPAEIPPIEVAQVPGETAKLAAIVYGKSPLTGCGEMIVPEYALVFFDHLYSEYLALRSLIKDPEIAHLLDAIHQRRLDCKLTWSDIYTFDLTLVQVRPPASLIRKAYDARQRYRSISGQKEYDEYIASNPPNLIEIKVAPNAEPPEPNVIVETALRADLEYLLSKFFLYYATLPERERLRDELTKRAVHRTLVFVGTLLVLILINLGVFKLLQLDNFTAGLTVLTVALAGVMGGCVSMLQRIQSTPSEGDALFNLASLNNGWTGLSLSPLYGGIFATLLFVLFAAGLLKGAAFPDIHTPSSAERSAPAPTPSATPTAPASTAPTPVPPATSAASPPAGVSSVSESLKPQTQPTPAPSGSPNPVPTPATQVLRIKTFLLETGPVDGISYALLIIWSFLAGFAERLVPDTLNRLVAKNQAIQGG